MAIRVQAADECPCQRETQHPHRRHSRRHRNHRPLARQTPFRDPASRHRTHLGIESRADDGRAACCRTGQWRQQLGRSVPKNNAGDQRLRLYFFRCSSSHVPKIKSPSLTTSNSIHPSSGKESTGSRFCHRLTRRRSLLVAATAAAFRSPRSAGALAGVANSHEPVVQITVSAT